jgi:hypothetical protein
LALSNILGDTIWVGIPFVSEHCLSLRTLPTVVGLFMWLKETLKFSFWLVAPAISLSFVRMLDPCGDICELIWYGLYCWLHSNEISTFDFFWLVTVHILN